MRLWIQFWRFALAQFATYRADVLMRVVGMAVMAGMMVFVLTLPYKYVDGLAGWSQEGVLMVLGFYYISNGIAWTFFKEGISKLEQRIRLGSTSYGGSLDVVLLKPVDSMFLVSFFDVDVTRLVDVGVGLFLVVTQAVRMDLVLSFWTLPAVGVTIVSGLVIVYSIYMIINTLAFWTTETYLDHVANPLFVVSKYPADIWGQQFSQILYWIVPVAFMSTVPAGLLMGKFDIWWSAAGIVVAVAWLTAARVFWTKAVKSYSGVGG